MKAVLIAAALAISLSGCGGGGSGGSSGTSPTASTKTELEGKWVYTTGSHLTGGVCGLDFQGNVEVRTTFVISNLNSTRTDETCWLQPVLVNGVVTSQGNTGAFIAGSPVAATITIGTVYLTSGADTYKELNITNSTDGTTLYTGYAINSSGNQFKLAVPNPNTGYDGSTAAKRNIVAGDVYVSGVGLISQPTFIKQ
jgi:hypothetical protein